MRRLLGTACLSSIVIAIGACSHAPPKRDARAPAARSPRARPKTPQKTEEAPVDQPSSDRPKEDDEPDLAAIEAEVHPEDAKAPILCEGAKRATETRAGGFIWPVDGVVISVYGQREGQPHEGIDVAAPIGTPIWATADGEVAFTGEQAGYGRLVIVKHANDLVTVYAHNAKNCVEDKAQVRQGDVIALVGQSGDGTSPAVHFEVRVGQRTVNPGKHLPQ